MAVVTNGHTNGVNGHASHALYERFSAVPAAIDIPFNDGDEAVNLDLVDLMDETDELCDMLQTENAAHNYWITIALAYTKQNKANIAIEFLQRGLTARQNGRAEERLSILACLCWMYLWKCRRAPRVKPTQATEDERTKEYWLHAATSTLNDASRISPSYPPLFLARGTLLLLRASLQPSKSGPGLQEQSERAETLKQAAKFFDDAYRVSGNTNIMAIIGKARTLYSLGRFPDALTLYQQALERAPDMIDPDPRIGIGCCLWQLEHKEIAKDAWERALALNPESKSANVLLGLWHLWESSQYSSNDPAFLPIYRKAMNTYTQTAFKLDEMHALTCSTFGGYFLLRRGWSNVEKLARRAIEHTDVNAIASDGWYLLARKEHYEGDLAKAQDFYNKADQARGGDEKGYLPAKFGIAQLRTLMQDYDGAKFRLEKMITGNRSAEATTLLGLLNAEDVFASQLSGVKADKSMERKKAIGLLEKVRLAWQDTKKRLQPDPAVLLNLARLYEAEQPDKALACLQQVEQMELDDIKDEDLPDELDDEVAIRNAKQDMLSPQLLNNIACFFFQADKLSQAREYFQSALRASVSIANKDETVDTDALVSTISFNLARTYEAEGIEDEATKIYNSLLERHPDYIDANSRLAYLALKNEPAKGAEAIKKLLDADPTNLEVRGLYGWYINRTKKRTLQINEDLEQRHYKHTLVSYDKHDIYSLVGMGNLHLTIAREMPRDTDQHKERRSKMYMRAVEFFDKVLTLDPKNAYAAQGMAIAVVEEKRDTSAAVQIFSKVRETIKDASVHINLGHIFCDLKQFTRSIEHYEFALAKSKGADAHIMACLGRVWLMRGRAEKNFEAFKSSLEFAEKALAISPDNINFRFNVAFVQIQIAQQMITLPEASKTLIDVEASSKGLDAAIEVFAAIAQAPTPPFPRGDLEQRANMGRNTQKRQLAAAIEKQAEYERKNAVKLEEARQKREAEILKRGEEKRLAIEKAEAEKRKIREERERMMEADRQAALARLEEEKAREDAEYTEDEETGERKKREKRAPKEKKVKRKKKKAEDDDDEDGLGGLSDGEEGGNNAKRRKSRRAARSDVSGSEAEDGGSRKKKKRRLERKGQAVKSSSKYKSAETVQDSSDDDDGLQQPLSSANVISDEEEEAVETPKATQSDVPEDDEMADDDGDAGVTAAPARSAAKRKPARVLDDDEDEDEEVAAAGSSDHGGD